MSGQVSRTNRLTPEHPHSLRHQAVRSRQFLPILTAANHSWVATSPQGLPAPRWMDSALGCFSGIPLIVSTVHLGCTMSVSYFKASRGKTHVVPLIWHILSLCQASSINNVCTLTKFLVPHCKNPRQSLTHTAAPGITAVPARYPLAASPSLVATQVGKQPRHHAAASSERSLLCTARHSTRTAACVPPS